MAAGSIIVFSNGDRKMEANMTNSSLPNEEAISFLVNRVYRAMTEEVPRERSRISGRNSTNVEEELSRNFQIPRVGAQQSPLYNNAWVTFDAPGWLDRDPYGIHTSSLS